MELIQDEDESESEDFYDAEDAEPQAMEGLNVDVTHRFDYALQDNENRENYENEARLTDYGTNWFPICGVSAVCFPGELHLKRKTSRFHISLQGNNSR